MFTPTHENMYDGWGSMHALVFRGLVCCKKLSMANDHWAGNDHGYGWESSRFLMIDRLIERVCLSTALVDNDGPMLVQYFDLLRTVP